MLGRFSGICPGGLLSPLFGLPLTTAAVAGPLMLTWSSLDHSEMLKLNIETKVEVFWIETVPTFFRLLVASSWIWKLSNWKKSFVSPPSFFLCKKIPFLVFQERRKTSISCFHTRRKPGSEKLLNFGSLVSTSRDTNTFFSAAKIKKQNLRCCCCFRKITVWQFGPQPASPKQLKEKRIV